MHMLAIRILLARCVCMRDKVCHGANTKWLLLASYALNADQVAELWGRKVKHESSVKNVGAQRSHLHALVPLQSHFPT